MSASEFYELQIMHVDLLNGHLEIWIGFTFATIAAFHLAGRRLNLTLLLLIEFLYVLGSYVFAVRYAHTTSVMGIFNNRLVAEGLSPYPAPHESIFVGMLVLFVIGSLGTVGYGIYAYANRKEAT